MTDIQEASSQDDRSTDDLLEQAIACHQEWKFDEAEALYRAILQREPDHADANHNLGVLLAIQLLRPQDALPYFEAALNSDAGNKQFWFSYLDALIRAGHGAMVRNLMPVAQASGVPVAALNSLLDRIDSSVEVEAASAAVPATAAASPASPGRIHWPSAAPLMAKAIGATKPRKQQDPSLAAQMELIQLLQKGEFEPGKARTDALLKQFPQSGFLWKTLGAMLIGLGETKKALVAERKAADLMPMDAEAHSNLGHLLQVEDQFQESIQVLRRALQLRPNYAEAYNNLANTYQRLGQVALAIQNYQRALEFQPDFRIVYSNYLFTLNYDPERSAPEIYRAYEAFEEKFGRPLRSGWRVHTNERNLARRLKVGYVSPDFRAHAVSMFMEPLIANHDKSVVEVYAYAGLAREDEVTQRYKGYVAHWIPTRGMSDEALAERIRADGIDILVDLAGHTQGNRLEVFARKPAPVSLSWLGYGYTTGLKAIDYYLTDEVCAPPGSEPLFSETPWRLPGGAYVYRANPAMGEVSPLPSLQRGYVTFGTLTRAIRVNHRTIRVWAEILKRVPGAKLVIDSSSYKDEVTTAELAARFQAHGVERERLLIGFHSPPWDLLRGMDIGLDCFPHNSGTTLFESLYMGLPYVTLADRPSVGRLGGAILHGVGHPEWIAESEQEYIEKAVALASDLPALAQLRADLRGQMQASKLMDGVDFARRVEQAYREMFRKWGELSQ